MITCRDVNNLRLDGVELLTGEVGLSGEIRSVTRIENRILEAEKLGFKSIIIPKHNLKGIDISKFKISIEEVSKVEEAVKLLFS